MPDGEKPARKRSSESRSPLILAGLVGASGVLCYFIKGTDGVVASLEGDLALLAIMVPRMIAALAIAGLVQVLWCRRIWLPGGWATPAVIGGIS